MQSNGPRPDKSDGIDATFQEIITASDLRAGRPGTVMAQVMDRTGADLDTVGAALRRLERDGVVVREGTCLRWEGGE